MSASAHPSDDIESLARDIFLAALDVAPEQRAVFVAARCAGVAELLRHVETLLATDARYAGTTFRPPPLPFARALAELDPNHSLIGSNVGAYRLTALLGQGGMGRVYRAERIDGQVEQVVAIKFLRRDLLGPQMLQRFRLERQVLAGLDHPGIAKLLDASELADGTPYFVMEHVMGVSIVDYCDRHRLGLRARLALFLRVCAAVEHAHQRLVVHRDIKPGNILVDAAGLPKLLDFGIAKPLDAALDGKQTGTAERFFSLATAAPEQLSGGTITIACDVYALGNLLYELLCGLAPFEFEGLSAGQAERVLRENVATPPSARAGDAPIAAARGFPSARQLARRLHGDLDGIALRCLRKAPVERYASIEQLRDDVSAYLDGRPVRARGGHTVYRMRKFVGRHRLSVAIGAAASVALAVAAVALVRQNFALVRERDRASYALEVMKQAFTSADPARAAGGDVTARQILDGARSTVESTQDRDPALFASLAATVASVQYAMHMAPQAAELSGRALAAARQSGAPPAELLDLLLLHSEALTTAGGAHAEIQAGLDEAARLGAAGTPRYALSRARLLCVEHRVDEAIVLLRAALAGVAATGPADPLTTELRWKLADALRLSGDDAGALAELDDMLRWQRAALPGQHPSIALTRLNRVDLLRNTRHPVEALAEARELAQAVDGFYGPASAFAALARSSLGLALRANDLKDEGIEADRAALDAWRRTLGPTHGNTIRATYNLAASLADDPKHWDEAERLYRDAFELGLHRSGPASALIAYFRMNYADFLRQRKRPAEALDLLLAPDADAGYALASKGNREVYAGIVRNARAALGCDVDSVEPRCAAATEWLARQRP